jgi:hypothetical protein
MAIAMANDFVIPEKSRRSSQHVSWFSIENMILILNMGFSCSPGAVDSF